MTIPLRLLLAEDSEDDALLLLHELRRGDWDLVHERVQSAEGMITALTRADWNIIISDYSMPQFNGIAALAIARERAADLPFILVSGTVGEEVAVEAMKAGANDYLFKGNLKRLVPAVQRELREAERRREAVRVRQELEERERQLADAQRLARLGSWHIDGRISEVTLSEVALQILGHSPLPVTMTFGKFMESVHPEDRTLLFQSLQDPQLKQLAHDLRVVQPDGTICFVHFRGDIVRGGEGWPIKATGMIQDITDRKHAEQDLQRAHSELAAAKEVAEAANRAKDHFLAVLSHELRTPLTPVLALASELEQNEELSAELRADLEIIRRNVVMEARLIDDLLDLTRITRNKIELHFEVVDIHEVVQRALRLFAKEISANGLEGIVNLRAPQHHVWADPARLEQVFMNLLSNAVKFTPRGGRIAISSRNDERGAWQGLIEDTGVGIEPEVLPRLFNSFEQGERTVTRRFGGLGLGLSIAKLLVEMHKGDIQAHSAGRNNGATLSVTLSTVRLPQSLPIPSLPLIAATMLSKRVLLVEDHEDTRRVMTRLLQASGCSVAAAATVREAVVLAEKEHFELLVSDIGLPDGTGLDVIKRIRSRYPIRGVAVSGFGQAEDIHRSREAGFEIHLTKPIDSNAFIKAVLSSSM